MMEDKAITQCCTVSWLGISVHACPLTQKQVHEDEGC